MNVRNMKELERAMLQEIKKAMNVASKKMLADMYDETGKYYTGSQPKVYERTGALGDTPKVTPTTTSGNSIQFEAYLDDTHQYTSGKNPTMTDVLNLANYGTTNSSVGKLRATVGNRGFWERAVIKIENTFDETMRNFFE